MVTASPKSIVVRLYDKSLTDLQLAYEAWKSGDIAQMRPHITSVQDIISHLYTSLDANIPVSQTLEALYRYHLIRLSLLFISPTEELFEEVKQFLTEWRATWWKAD